MLMPAPYIILTAFMITLPIYRVPTPIGYNMSFYHIPLMAALFIGMNAIFLKALRPELDKEVKHVFTIFILFAGYSSLSFIRNFGSMRPESMSAYFSEVVGYIMVISVVIFIDKKSHLQKMTKAFMASAIFVYLGAFWHLYNYVVLDKYVTGVPFWQIYSKSENVVAYLERVAWFGGFPRFRLPFGSSAGTGLFLSLAGLLLLSYTLYHIACKKKVTWMLILLNLVNFFCLLGTFARASWAVFLFGSLCILWYFIKLNMIKPGRVALTLIIASALFFAVVSITPFGDEFLRMVGLRFSPDQTRASNLGHLASRKLALHYWLENPVAGLGVGGFFLKPMGGIHTHSTYFTLLVNRGLVGLLLYLFFIFKIFSILRTKGLKSEFTGYDSMPYAIGFLGCLTGLFVGNFLYQISTEVVWLLLGIMICYIKLLTKSRCIDERTRTL